METPGVLFIKTSDNIIYFKNLMKIYYIITEVYK